MNEQLKMGREGGGRKETRSEHFFYRLGGKRWAKVSISRGKKGKIASFCIFFSFTAKIRRALFIIQVLKNDGLV